MSEPIASMVPLPSALAKPMMAPTIASVTALSLNGIHVTPDQVVLGKRGW
jgi:hypothetical protein